MIKVIGILGIIIALSVLFTGCVQYETEEPESKEESTDLEEITDNINSLGNLENNLDSEDIEDFHRDLEDFDW